MKDGKVLMTGKGNRAYKPAGPGGGPAANAGQERRADMGGAGAGGGIVMSGPTGLKAAMSELQTQHPEKYSDMGPHQGGSSHIRHMPLHGMKPGK